VTLRNLEVDVAPKLCGDEILMSTATVLSSLSEVELVKRTKAGDEHAFVELVRHFERRVFRIARQITMNDLDAEDVLIETFMKVFSALDEYQERGRFWVWLVSITAHQALMKVGNPSEAPMVSDDNDCGRELILHEISPWGDNNEGRFSEEETTRILESAMQSLDPLHRAVFVLRDIEQMSMEDTAIALGLSPSAAKHRLLRARLRLGEKLTRHFGQQRGRARHEHGNLSVVANVGPV
jgi:RNA polymerase sigma-70 factor (ECF subfamily)